MDPSFMEPGDTYPLDRIPADMVEIVRNSLKRRRLSLIKRSDEWYVGKLK